MLLRRRLVLVALAALTLPVVASAQAAVAKPAASSPRLAPLVGEWAGGLTFQAMDLAIHLQFVRRDSTVAGMLTVTTPDGAASDSTWSLAPDGDAVTFTWSYQNMSVTFRGTIVADTISGTYSVAQQGSGPWWAVRKKVGDGSTPAVVTLPRTSTARPGRPAAR